MSLNGVTDDSDNASLASASLSNLPSTLTQHRAASALTAMPPPAGSGLGRKSTSIATSPSRAFSPLHKPSIAVRLNAPTDRSQFREVDISHDKSLRQVTPVVPPQPGSASSTRKETPVPPPQWPGMRPAASRQFSVNPSQESTTIAKAQRTVPPPPEPLGTPSNSTTQAPVPSTKAVASTASLVETAVPLPTPLQPEPSTSATSVSASTTGRGRPKGWKPGMSYAAMRGRDPAAATAAALRTPRKIKPRQQLLGVTKRRGRPPRPRSPGPRDIYLSLDTDFIAFLCEWTGCKAELHNLETLRRHVYIVHVRSQDPERRQCRWGKCGHGSAPTPKLRNEAGLDEHLEEAHFVPLGWHVGDGPTNTSGNRTQPEEEDIPDYLKDENGNQVTPSIRDQKIEDLATWRSNRRKLKELLIQRDMNLPTDESSEGSNDETSQDIAV